jgi:hypothetical protein
MKVAIHLAKRGMALLAMIFTIAGVSIPSVAAASIITFEFTGRLTVVDPYGNLFNNINNGGWQTPIGAALTYDTNIGVTSSTLNVNIGDWYGSPAIVRDITTLSMTGNIIDAQYLGDWNGNNNMPAHVQWDATGLVNAIGYGLQVGDKISGNSLYRDYNHDGIYDPSELLTANLGSATPYSDSLIAGLGIPPQGYAPLAATSASQGFTAGPFTDVVAYFDIGSGNSMYVTSVSAVPVPAAVWLFGSGLLGLLGVARRKAS